jgi:DNA-directed RNA polymerase III subunit RPC8
MDILSTTEGAVLFGDGCFYYKSMSFRFNPTVNEGDRLMRIDRRYLAVFRLIMFRPFIGEAFLGKVVSSSPSGLTGSFCFPT